jgi:lipopolysaccharide/colanic/teichoic acid biosynthesis glycosyltransferase
MCSRARKIIINADDFGVSAEANHASAISEGELSRARWPIAKRLLDVAVAAAGLLALSPVMAIVAMFVRLRLGTPVLFRQVRPGWKGKPFWIVKFRTMRQGSGPDCERLTVLGRFLRRTSLDELPELWNVLRGDMSLVGPRPLLMDYFDFFTTRERQRFLLPPGITGWAQIHGRNHVSWDERLEHDVWYVEHWSLSLDLRILASTVLGVLRADGVEEDPRAAMLDLNEERSR